MIKDKAMELVAALRSGDYQQTTGVLRRVKKVGNHPVGYCCLGVACEVSGLGKWEDRGKDPVNILGYRTPDKFLDTGILPPMVRDHFGFTTSGGGREDEEYLRFPGMGAYSSLWDANDAGIPFSKIADYIEKNWEHL